MEIIIVLVAFVLFALLIMAMRNPSQTVQEPVPEPVPEAPYKIETPAAEPLVLVSESRPVIEETTPVVELVVEEQPVKKTRKPRAPKVAPAPVVAAKKSTRGRAASVVAVKTSAVTKTRKPRSKKV